MAILAVFHKDSLGNILKIYRQFVNINKALSDYNNLAKITSSTTINAFLPQTEAKEEIVRLRRLCTVDILNYFNNHS